MCEVIKNLKSSTVADVGCAETTFVQYLKQLETVTKAIGVDLDQSLLDYNKKRSKPLILDYLNPRDIELFVQLLCGSACEFDSRLSGLDFIAAIEIIEHIPVHEVPKFTENIFGNCQPDHVLVSTPNSDFNVVFEFELGQMRHWDHRFEWSQSEFVEWCEGVVSNHDYTYEITGVGNPPVGQDSIGFCTQIAIFHRVSEAKEMSESLIYKEIFSIEYPVKDKSISREQHIINEVLYQSNSIGTHERVHEGLDTSHVSLQTLLTYPSISQYELTESELKVIILASDLVLDEQGDIIVSNYPPSSSSSEDEESEDVDYNTEPLTQQELYKLEEPW